MSASASLVPADEATKFAYRFLGRISYIITVIFKLITKINKDIFSMITKFHYRASFFAISLIPFALFLTACGETADNKEGAESPHQEAKITSNNKENSTKNLPRKLDTTPINLGDVFDTGPAKFAAMSECPFLSDKTAINTTSGGAYAKAGEELNERKRVSNTHCMWLTGLVVDILSTDSAKTHKKIVEKNPDRYFLKKQKSPGTDASILYYQTKRNKPAPVGFGFIQNGKYINIEAMVSLTSTEQLHKVANEVATRLPNAPTIKSQEQKRIRKVKVCDTWQKEALKTLFNVENVGGRSRGAEGCQFSLSFNTEKSYKLKLILDFRKYKNGCKHLEKNSRFTPEATIKNYSVFSSMTKSAKRVRHELYACSDDVNLELSTETFLIYPEATDKTGLLENHSEKLQQLLSNLVKRVQ